MKVLLSDDEKRRVRFIFRARMRELRRQLQAAISNEFSCPTSRYARRVFLLGYRTHIGDHEFFIRPIKEEIDRFIDDALWDELYPVIAECSNKRRKRLPTHAGTFKNDEREKRVFNAVHPTSLSVAKKPKTMEDSIIIVENNLPQRT